MYPEAERFWIFFAMCVVQHYLGELLTIISLAIFQNVGVAQSAGTLILSVCAMIGPGLIR